MRVLELFKGTGSLTKYCEANGWECVSLDIEPKFGATHTCDILDFDYTQYPELLSHMTSSMEALQLGPDFRQS